MTPLKPGLTGSQSLKHFPLFIRYHHLLVKDPKGQFGIISHCDRLSLDDAEEEDELLLRIMKEFNIDIPFTTTIGLIAKGDQEKSMSKHIGEIKHTANATKSSGFIREGDVEHERTEDYNAYKNNISWI
ncbi:uncharacterized protein EV154DRAFT_486823 [Mucor mucedo]|uniref:uncharacterized protein n=1 Tax=Mucor mucedo TaxID=29922 RepID=UPI00221FBC2A|nr:uncharacterized protein EV154DRAFT_486823 [Mucor mucedo]KAI7875093.1 hypothetical protein EV154DRAFT_486823 [Mucor mucedo]